MSRVSKNGNKELPPIKVGNVSIPRYICKDGRLAIVYPTKDNPRKVQLFTDHAKGNSEAEKRARELHNGGSESQIFTSADRADMAQAKKDLASFGIAVHVATSQWGDEERQVRAAGFKRSDVFSAGIAALSRKPYPVPEVVEEFLATLKPQDLHGRYTSGLITTLRAFALDFRCDIREVKAPEIQRWLDGVEEQGIVSGGRRKRRGGDPVGTRRRDNILKEVRAVFEYARLNSKLPNEVAEASKVKLIHKKGGSISFYSIGETRLILEHVSEEWFSVAVLVLFNGFRIEELVKHRQATKRKDPLRWEDFDFSENEIIVREETSKVDAGRVVPLHEITRELLAPYVGRGYVGPQDSQGRFKRSDKEFGKSARLERKINQALTIAPQLKVGPIQLDLIQAGEQPELITEFAYRSNAMRHSYGSYRASILKNEHALAEEMGTSVSMIRKHYRNPRPTSEARAYFAIRRSKDPIIVPFPVAQIA